MEVFLVFYFVWLSIQVVNFHTCEERYTVSSLVEPKIYLISTVEINKNEAPVSDLFTLVCYRKGFGLKGYGFGQGGPALLSGDAADGLAFLYSYSS